MATNDPPKTGIELLESYAESADHRIEDITGEKEHLETLAADLTEQLKYWQAQKAEAQAALKVLRRHAQKQQQF